MSPLTPRDRPSSGRTRRSILRSGRVLGPFGRGPRPRRASTPTAPAPSGSRTRISAGRCPMLARVGTFRNPLEADAPSATHGAGRGRRGVDEVALDAATRAAAPEDRDVAGGLARQEHTL